MRCDKRQLDRLPPSLAFPLLSASTKAFTFHDTAHDDHGPSVDTGTMANPQRPTMSSHSSTETYGDRDPFSDGHPRIQFQDPPVPQRGGMPQPFESSTSLPQEFGGHTYNDLEDEEEKVPLTGDQGFVGGLYPPG